MATNQTTKYQLNQWEPADAVQRVEFNQDNAKLDTALKSLSDQVVQKANQSALNTLISAVNQKADASTVSSLSQTVAAKAEQNALTEEINARTAVDTVLAQKAGMQLIQQIQLVESDGYVNQLLSIDWDQWGIVWLVFRPKFSESTSYNTYFFPQPFTYFGEDVYDDLAVQLYPFFHADMEIKGHTWVGKMVSGDSHYQDVMGIHITSYSGHLMSGSTLTIWGSK